MIRTNINKILKSDYLILSFILILAYYLAFIPHLNYPYLVHLDEWIHLACSNQIINQGTAQGIPSPFDGGATSANQLYERGFHILWAVFRQISGLSWLSIFKYSPGIIFMFTILSVFVLTRRERFGWQAAFFTCFITTTVGILGPGFLVPVALGLLFLPLFIFIAYNFKNWWSYVVLLIFMSFLLTMHSATAINLVIIIIPFVLLELKGDYKHSLGIILALVLPFVISLPRTSQFMQTTWESLPIPYTDLPFGGVVELPRIITIYGQLPIMVFFLGILMLAIQNRKRSYGLILGTLALLLMLSTFYTLHYGLGILYVRGLLQLMLMIGIIAGAGLMGIKNIRLPAKLSSWPKAHLVNNHIGNAFCLVVIALTLFFGIPIRQHFSYYHMIDTEDYEAFIWIKENTDSSYNKAILDPWKGVAFVAITEKYVYTWIGALPTVIDHEAVSFLNGGSKDTEFLRNNGISIVYSQQEVHNPDLVEVRKNIYLLKETKEPE